MTSYHEFDASDAVFELDFVRPTDFPRGLAIAFLLLCHTPMLALITALHKRDMKYEMLVAFGVLAFGITQAIHEVHDKAKCWDDIHLCGGAHTFTREDGSFHHSFDWDALTNTTWIGLDFFQWQRLFGVGATILVCQLLVDMMQNKSRESDRALGALFTAGILIISEWCNVNDLGLVTMASLPITAACLIALGRIIQHLFEKRYRAERRELIATLASLFFAILFFLLQHDDEGRKSSLARPFYGLYVFCASFTGFFSVLAFRNRLVHTPRTDFPKCVEASPIKKQTETESSCVELQETNKPAK